VTDSASVGTGDRGQANLLAVVVAVLALATAAGFGVFLADAALDGERRDAGERATAVELSERLVDAEEPIATRPNVLNASRVERLDAEWIATRYPAVADAAVRVRLGDRVVAERGMPTDGTTVRRIVTVEREGRETITPALSTDGRRRVTLPRRTDRVLLRIAPPNDATVRTVRIGDRVVLHDPDGLNGTYEVTVSRLETVELSVSGDGSLPEGAVAVTYFPTVERKTTLAVTVDA
jgi:hypothetical protein